jgi:protein-glutamine gamma-glutamyltransferase
VTGPWGQLSAQEAARLPLRIAVVVAGLAGLAALATARLLPAPVMVAAAGCFLVASGSSLWLPDPEPARLRRRVSVAVLLAVAAVGVHSARVGLGQDPLTSIGPVLALLLCGLQLAHALVLNTRRDLLVGLTIGLFMTVLAAGLAPGPAVAAPLVVGWPVAVTALVLAQRLEQLEPGHPLLRAAAPGPAVAPGDRAAPGARSATIRTTAAAVAITVAAGLVVFLLLPQPNGLSARSRLLGSGAQLDVSSGEVRGTGFYSGGVMDLRTRGTLSDQPVVDVPGGSPQLWRGTVLSTYDGQSWYGSTSTLLQLTPGPTYSVPDRLDQTPAGTSRTDLVRLLDQFGGSVVAPGVVSVVTVSGRLLLDSDGGLTITGGSDGLSPTSYTVTSTPEVTDPAVLAAAGAAGTPAAPPDAARWLQLPDTLPQRVRDLATQVTAGTTNRYDEVKAVETYLRGHEKYQLDSPVPAPGADAVDDFLFTSNAGFCEQFASAEVVLLRARGIPARMVTGLAYGTPQADGTRRMLVSNAHAWVEVWYPAVGWSPSDPTAGSTLAAPGGSNLLTTAWHDVFDSAGRRAVGAGGVGVLAVLAVMAAGWAGRRRRARVAAALRLAVPPPGPVLAAYRRLERALADGGRGRRPGETLAELARRLPPGGSAAMATLELECYGPGAPTADEASAAERAFDELVLGLAEVTRR